MIKVKRPLSYLFFVLASLLLLACSSQTGPVKIIFDTDFGGDADDLGALVMLHHLQDAGECSLEAVMCWSTERHAVAGIDAVNHFYGYPDTPLGVRKGGSHQQAWNYGKPVAEAFPHDLDQDEAPDATRLYREILAAADDQEIVLVTVGPLKNILDLLESGADELSPLNGLDLLHLKVREVVIMGGRFPEGRDEWNFNGGMPGVTLSVLEQLEMPVILSGFEVGVAIRSGAVFNEQAIGTPLYTGFIHFSEHAPWIRQNFQGRILDNATFDQTAVLYAVRGAEPWFRLSDPGRCLPDSTGGNRWEARENGSHRFLVINMDAGTIAEEIEGLMLGK